MALTRTFRNVLVMFVAFSLVVAAVWLVASNQARAASSSGDVVYVATGENFPDALGGGPVAAMVRGPVLLVRQNSVPGVTAAELARLSPDKIVIIGGTGVVSADVETDLGAFAATVERIGGTDRYDTAAQLSAATFPVSSAALEGKTGRVGYVFANEVSSASYTPDPTWTWNSSAGAVTITRSSTGRYTVTFAGLGSNGGGLGGHAQVTAFSTVARVCQVTGWTSAGVDVAVDVRCFNISGAPTDSRYDVLFTW